MLELFPVQQKKNNTLHYYPQNIVIPTGTTVGWFNDDPSQPHTVTSGSPGSADSGKQFNSGIIPYTSFMQYTFDEPGSYLYYREIHPWMEGVVTVTGKPVIIPNYPVDASGKKIMKMPIYLFTPDRKMEVGLSWDPNVLLTGREISFFVNFFDSANNKPNILPFDFVLIQNGKQLERIPSMAQIGMNVQHFVFSNSGPIMIRVENIGGEKSWNTQFNSTVFENPGMSLDAANQLAEQYKSSVNSQSSNPFRVSPLTLIYTTYAVIFGIPAATGLIYFLYRKGKI